MDLVAQQYWDASYNEINYYIANDAVTDWLEKQLIAPFGKNIKNVFEFGCFPGRYLAHLGKKGLEVNGMDLTRAIERTDFKAWLVGNGIRAGDLQSGDALAYAAKAEARFDLVCSFGFIEHFTSFEKVILLHDRLTKPGGFIAITTPNFRGLVQQSLHRFVDGENLKRHHLPSMQPGLWSKLLKQQGYSIHFSGHIGGFDFWHDNPELSNAQKIVNKICMKVKPVLNLLPSSASLSPFCAILAQKPKA